MFLAGLVAAFLAVNAERRSLEDIAKPLTAAATKAREATKRGDGDRKATA
ncbi:hypothetical protein QA942_34475 [Streptomyces sp. B21-106]